MRTSYVMVESAAAHAARFQGAGYYDDAGLYERTTGHRMGLPQRTVDEMMPQVMKDCPEHVLPGGNYVTSHSRRREIMKANGWSDYEPINTGSFARRGGGRPTVKHKDGGYISESFTKKRGLKTSAGAQEWMANTKAKKLEKCGWTAKTKDN